MSAEPKPIWCIVDPRLESENVTAMTQTEGNLGDAAIKFVPESLYAPLLKACEALLEFDGDWVSGSFCPVCNSDAGHRDHCVFKAIYEAYGKIQGTETEK